MNGSQMAAPNPKALLRASEAVTNWRALATTVLGGIAIFLFVALTGWLARSSFWLGSFFGLITIIVALIAYSAVGIILMRQAQGREVGIMDAVLQALFTVHRLFGVGILLGLIFLGIVLASLLILLLCKIPGLGTLLYGIAYPILAIVLGVTIAGLFYVGFPLAAPAIWEGNSVFQTIARLTVIVRRRLLSVIVNLLTLILLVAVLSGVVSFVLISGNMAAVGLSSAVNIPVFGGMGSLLHSFMMGGADFGGYGNPYSDVSSYTYAFGFGTGLLFTLGAIVPVLTAINGNCLIYLQAIEGLEFGAAEEQLRAGVDEAKRRAQEARDRASSKLEESKAAIVPAAASASTAAAAPRGCSHCHAPLGADDLFCGECGTKNPL